MVENKTYYKTKMSFSFKVLFLFLFVVNGAKSQVNFISEDDQGSGIPSYDLLLFSVLKAELHQSIQWTTSSEYNTNFFIVEKSSNGFDFEVIGAQAAVGNSTKRSTYVFQDTTANDDVNYFRIKYVSHNGVEEIIDELKMDHDFFLKTKKIEKITDHQGNEVNEMYRGLVMVYYKDGTSEKKIL
jgi:hypothetical protein